jgi:hypothetical protein
MRRISFTALQTKASVLTSAPTKKSRNPDKLLF